MVVLLPFAVGASSFPSGETAWPADAVAGSMLITIAPGSDMPATVQAARRGLDDAGMAAGAVTVLSRRVAKVMVQPGQETAASTILTDLPGVAAVEPDWVGWLSAEPDDPYFPKQWAHIQARATAAWDLTTGSGQVTVAVVDSGMRGDHPDLADNIRGQIDLSTGELASPPRTGVDNDTCDIGHGTAVGGVLGAVGENARGVAGVAWDVGLLDIAVNSTRPGASCEGIPFSVVIAGIDYAVNDALPPADVVNLSLGGYVDACPTAMQSVIQDARALGAVIVAAAGNGQQDPETANAISYPAGCDGVIGVGATTRDATRAPYSSVSPAVDLVAPGGSYDHGGMDGLVLTTHHAYQTAELAGGQGTSFATPYVAGTVALMRALAPLSGPDSIRDVLQRTARDLGTAGRDDATGHGLLDAGAAVAAATGATPNPRLPSEERESSQATDDQADSPTTQPTVQRLAPDSTPTRAVPVAARISQELFPDDGAAHVVLSRADTFADALAGSSLTAGGAPLLYTPSTGSLAPATRNEIRRVLAPDGVVYLLGGTAAIPAAVEDELRRLGYTPKRLAGPTREATAVAIANERRALSARTGRPSPPAAILATSHNWPDAVTAGALAASFRTPLLLTPPGQLHPATRHALHDLGPDTLYITGGTTAISKATATQAAQAADAHTLRLAGNDRLQTALEVAEEYDRTLRTRTGAAPQYVMAVNIWHPDSWPAVLAASAIAGRSTGLFLPLADANGTTFRHDAQQFLEGRYPHDDRVLGLVIGATDLATNHVPPHLEDLLTQ